MKLVNFKSFFDIEQWRQCTDLTQRDICKFIGMKEDAYRNRVFVRIKKIKQSELDKVNERFNEAIKNKGRNRDGI